MVGKPNFFQDNEDIVFQFTKRLHMEEIFDWTSKEEKEALSVNTPEEFSKTWQDIMSTIGEFAGSTLMANQDKVSKAHLSLGTDGEVVFPPELLENMQTFIEIGGPALGIDPQFGGIGGFAALVMFCQEIISRACPSTMLNTCWYGAIAAIIEEFGTEELRHQYVSKIASGEYSGSMSLTEPDAGSDLASIRSYAEKQDDGSWKVYGSKQFISNGNGMVSLVLAKNKKGSKSLNDINLYLVPRILDGKPNFRIAKLEEKPGLHGSATAALDFDGSIGFLLGEDGKGFSYMLKLMNEARVAVGFQSLGLMEASYRLAAEFASQRRAFGKTIDKHELIAEKLLNLDVDIRALRSLATQASRYLSLVEVGERRLKDPTIDVSQKAKIKPRVKYVKNRAREWTPLIKYWAGERSFQHARDGLQIHGGYGYSTEYKPEWLVRESLILSIYEGTSQIQALMCMKDTLKEIIQRPNEFVEITLGTHWKAVSEKDPLRKKIYRMMRHVNASLVSVMKQLVKENVRHQYNANKSSDIFKLLKVLSRNLVKFDDLSPALLHAERVTEMKAIVAMARCLMWDAKEDPSRRWIAEHFIHRYYPVVLKNRKEIGTENRVLKGRIAGVL